MYRVIVLFLFLFAPLFIPNVNCLSNFKRFSNNTYNSYSFNQTDSKSRSHKSDKSDTSDNLSDNKNQVKARNDSSDSNSSNSDTKEKNLKDSNSDNSDSSSSTSSNENNGDDDSSLSGKDGDSDNTSKSNGKNESAGITTTSLILNPSIANVDYSIKTLRDETASAVGSLKRSCTLVQELISVMPQDVKKAEIELFTHKIVISEFYSECVKNLNTLETYENDLDKFTSQVQISLAYPPVNNSPTA